MKSIRPKLVEKLWNDLKICVNIDDLKSVKGKKGYGQVAWFTLFRHPLVSSELTMSQCIKLPLKKMDLSNETIIEIDLEKAEQKELL